MDKLTVDLSAFMRPPPSPNEALDKALGCEKLLFRERVLEASKFIVDSNSSGPGNEASHCRSRAEGCSRCTVNDELMRGVATTLHACETSACHPR